MSYFFIKNWKQTSLKTPIELYGSLELQTYAENPQLNAPQNKTILLVGGVHGDEPEGVILAQECLNWLKTQTQLKNWLLIPCLNIDGFNQKTRGNAQGVDLNRNYPSKNWSADYEQARYNPGPSPASENETQAVVELIKSFKPRLIIHCHSWQPCIVLSGPMDLIEAQYLSESTGYKIVPDIGYPTPGSLSSYGWYDQKIPIICTEEQEHSDLKQTWPRFSTGLKKVFELNQDTDF